VGVKRVVQSTSLKVWVSRVGAGKKKSSAYSDDVEGSDLDFEPDVELNSAATNQKKRKDVGASRDGRRMVPDEGRVGGGGGMSTGHKRGDPNGIDRGIASLSQDKLILIRAKKEEIEKAYRQDCETFATVAKMLISKDQDLEERIQPSLRDNLKEIGQRCIQELREFVDRLKTEDDM